MANERKIDMVILGLLSHEPLTGYDIKKRIDNSIRFFWKGSFGSIYPALCDMEAKGLVFRMENKNIKNRREKIEYSITETGRETLIGWLKTSQTSNEIKYEILLKLFFGGSAGSKIAIKNINAFESDIKAELELLTIYKKNLSNVLDEQDHVYYYLTVAFGVEMYEGFLRWCKLAKGMLVKIDE